MAVIELEKKRLPFYNTQKLHEYDKQKRAFLMSEKGSVAEVTYFSSFGKNKHWILVSFGNSKFEVEYEIGIGIVSVVELEHEEKQEVTDIFKEMIDDYVKKENWIIEDNKNSGVVKLSNLFVKYSLTNDDYSSHFKKGSRFYKFAF